MTTPCRPWQPGAQVRADVPSQEACMSPAPLAPAEAGKTPVLRSSVHPLPVLLPFFICILFEETESQSAEGARRESRRVVCL